MKYIKIDYHKQYFIATVIIDENGNRELRGISCQE